MDEPVVCLGCGLEVGRLGGCVCTPPPVSKKPASSHPYRGAIEGIVCPRCDGRLIEESLHDVTVLDCAACRGFFLDRATLEKVCATDGHDLRLAFPKRDQGDANNDVRYLHCPICRGLMNRTIFARVSGVIVDVCKADGIWLDVGEVNAIVSFVEKGGMQRAAAKAKAEHDAEKAKLAAEFTREHAASVAAQAHLYGRAAPLDDTVALALFELFRR